MKFSLQRFAIIALFIFSTGCSVWQNFTAYFNRYYNAKQKFEEAEEQLKLESKKSLFEFKEDVASAKVKSALDIVIDKCSKLMQFNKESSFYDDAIFMIGKSYYYQGIYIKALRKFRELQIIPESGLHLENELWIAKALFQNRQFDEAQRILDQVIEKSIAEDEEEIITEALLTKVRYLIYIEDYANAVQFANQVIEYSDSDVLNAEVLYETGKLYLKMDEPENAEKAFLSVLEYEPSYDIEFLSKLESAKVAKQLGHYEQSLELLNDLADEDKYKDKFDLIDFEIAEVYYKQNEIEKALKKFSLIDSLYKNSQSIGPALFRRAEILEKDLLMLDSSRVLYEKVSQSTASPELKNSAREKSLILKKLQDLKANIKLNERQLSYLRDSANFVADVKLYKDYITQRDSLKKFFKEMRQLEGQSFDSTKYLVRKAPFASEPVYPTLSEDSLKSNIVKSKYELGNLFFGELNIPDSSRSQYEDILIDYSGSRLEAKSLFALASYFLTKNQKQIADSLYREIYNNHKFNPLADEAAERLGLEKISRINDPAEKEYLEAEKLIEQKKYKNAISQLNKIYSNNSKSPYAAKALYSIGYLYENELGKNDSAAAVYDSLTKKFPKTEFASSVKSKLSFYNSRQAAIKDSIAKKQAALEEAKKSKDKKSDQINSEVKTDIKSIAEKPDSTININPQIKTQKEMLESGKTSIDSVQKNQKGIIPKSKSS